MITFVSGYIIEVQPNEPSARVNSTGNEDFEKRDLSNFGTAKDEDHFVELWLGGLIEQKCRRPGSLDSLGGAANIRFLPA